MDSLNVPIPSSVRGLAADLRPWLTRCDSVREDLSLVLKRLGDWGPASTRSGDSARTGDEHHRLRERLRPVLTDAGPIRVRVTGTGVFRTPPVGRAPVVYLAVESPQLVGLHDRLVTEFGAVENVEGGDYTPHITLARGGDPPLEELLALEVDPVTWTVHELEVWDREYRAPTATVPL